MANKPRLPRTRPFLDVLLALNGGTNFIVSLEIDQVVKTVSLGEANDRTGAVLVGASYGVVGDADIERPGASAGEDVNARAPTAHAWSTDSGSPLSRGRRRGWSAALMPPSRHGLQREPSVQKA